MIKGYINAVKFVLQASNFTTLKSHRIILFCAPYYYIHRFSLVGYDCMTCVNNSGRLAEPIVEAIEKVSIRELCVSVCACVCAYTCVSVCVCDCLHMCVHVHA